MARNQGLAGDSGHSRGAGGGVLPPARLPGGTAEAGPFLQHRKTCDQPRGGSDSWYLFLFPSFFLFPYIFIKKANLLGTPCPDHRRGKGSLLSPAHLCPGTALGSISNPISTFGWLLSPPPAQPVLWRGRGQEDTCLQRKPSNLRGSPTPWRGQCPGRFLPSSTGPWLVRVSPNLAGCWQRRSLVF